MIIKDKSKKLILSGKQYKIDINANILFRSSFFYFIHFFIYLEDLLWLLNTY